MLAYPDSPSSALPQGATPQTLGLMTVALRARSSAFPAAVFVTSLDGDGVARVQRELRSLGQQAAEPLAVELAYVSTPASELVLAPLTALEGEGVLVDRRRLTSLSRAEDVAAFPADTETSPAHATAAFADAATPSTHSGHDPTPPMHMVRPDSFGFDPDFHARWLPVLGLFADHYWRIAVDGLEHVPDTGAVLVAANHSGAIPADAAMLATTLARRHPARRTLRVLYDRFVDQLPLLPSIYRRFGAVPASRHNAETLLARGEAVALFPEGAHGLEKTWRERYRLRPFRSGTARLALRTGVPIVPVAVVGAEEAYPVVARLYRAGTLVGVPWIPVTPLFPLCGIAGTMPLPTKWYIRFGKPITPPRGAVDENAVQALTNELQAALQRNLSALLRARRGLFL